MAKKTIYILALGGTIAGVGSAEGDTDYTPGQLNIGKIIRGVSGIGRLADICGEQVCNKNSDDITQSDWLSLARRINQLAKKDASGFVITHGTDTLEETAYFLNLTVKTDKPIVVTGAMRPATALSADGPMNLYQAVALAASDDAMGRGVLVAFSDKIYAARYAEKVSTYQTAAFSGSELGCIGTIRGKTPFFFCSIEKKHTTSTMFDISETAKLPSVGVAYFHVDADEKILRSILAGHDAVVIAGAGNGEMSQGWLNVLAETAYNNKAVVVSSRTGGSVILSGTKYPPNFISAGCLNPQKARILLMLALNKTSDPNEIKGLFEQY